MGGAPPGGNGSRKKRRRQRSNRVKGRGPSASAHGERANRERIFQDVEGLLRQIRELAEENAVYSAEQLAEYTHVVVGLFKLLESEGQVVSDRAFSDYMRVRERLSQALHSQLAEQGDESSSL